LHEALHLLAKQYPAAYRAFTVAVHPSTTALNHPKPTEKLMKFMLMCQFQPAAFASVSAADEAQMMEAMMGFNHQLIQAGVLLAAGQLAPPETSQRVFAKAGRIQTEDGPALPGDTQIGGYYLIDVPGEPEATGWAAQCPAAQFGAIEVRQVAFSPL
jgi:hypothetical protein